MRKAGRELNLNLDEYVTALLASDSLGKRRNAPLTLYAAIPGRFALSLCSCGASCFLHTPRFLRGVAGMHQPAPSLYPPTRGPLSAVRGGAVHRLHPWSQPVDSSISGILAIIVGNFLKEVDKAFYFRILNNKNSYFDYAVVPKNPCTSIIPPGQRDSCGSRLLPGKYDPRPPNTVVGANAP